MNFVPIDWCRLVKNIHLYVYLMDIKSWYVIFGYNVTSMLYFINQCVFYYESMCIYDR